jgi:hypothetical protein
MRLNNAKLTGSQPNWYFAGRLHQALGCDGHLHKKMLHQHVLEHTDGPHGASIGF